MKFKDIFSKDSESNTLVLLAIIRNDLNYSLRYIVDSFRDEHQMEDGRQLYHQRIAIIHFREAMKVLTDHEDLIINIIRISSDDQIVYYEALYNSIVEYASPYKESDFYNDCKPMRDKSVHYSRNLNVIESIYDNLPDNYELSITDKGKIWTDRIYDFADDYAVNIYNDHLVDMDITKVVETTEVIDKHIANLINLIDYILLKFIHSKSL